MAKDLTGKLREAFGRFNAQDMAGAERLCGEILARAPNHPQALHLRGVMRLMGGNAQEAVSLLGKAVKGDPDDAAALENLGVAYLTLQDPVSAETAFRKALKRGASHGLLYMRLGLALGQQGKLTDAEEALRTAVARAPADPDVHNNLGNALTGQERHEEALACYRKVLALQPRHVTAFFNIGTLNRRMGRSEEAISAFQSALAIAPDYADCHNNLGTVYEQLGRLEEAAACYRRALELEPNHVHAHSNLGSALRLLGRLDEALASFDRALAMAPGFAEALYNRGNALLELKRPEEALASYERALAIKPDYADALNNMGNALAEQGKLEQAEEKYERAIALYTKAKSGLGVVRHDQGRMDEALKCFEQALVRSGSLAGAQYNLAITRLYRQEFEAAWPWYEHRLAFADVRSLIRGNLATVTLYEQLERWQGPGQAIAGAVGIWGEHGIGDHVLYATLIPELIASGTPFIYEVDRRLVGAYERAFPASRFVAQEDPPQEVLLQAKQVLLAGSLPALFRRSRESFARQPRRLLSALPERVAYYRSQMNALGPGPKVALSWRSKRQGRLGRGKSVPLMQFAPLFELEGVHFVDVQYGDTVAERGEVDRAFGVRLLHFDEVDYFHDLEEMLAILEACDLVITTSNVNAHLAGALGKPVWLLYLAERAPFHYWAHDGSHRSLWYPSVEIVSAPHFTTWEPLIDHVKARLARELTQGP